MVSRVSDLKTASQLLSSSRPFSLHLVTAGHGGGQNFYSYHGAQSRGTSKFLTILFWITLGGYGGGGGGGRGYGGGGGYSGGGGYNSGGYGGSSGYNQQY